MIKSKPRTKYLILFFFHFQLLTTACEVSSGGHAGVPEALSTLRLRYGEPCRFRFLAGMVQSGGGELPAAGLRLLAALLRGAPSPKRRLYLQAELDQAGLDVSALRKVFLFIS